MADLLNELRERSLLYQTTDEAELREHLAQPRRIYAGFDPTADSLTIGNLVPIMALRHFQKAGHTPIVIMGGGTGLIGDPSGKEAERQLRTREEVQANVDSQRRIFESMLSFEGDNAAKIINNVDWLGELSYIDVLRDVGKHFSVNMMIQKESVKQRLENREQGISYTEFSYMILQAYDFLHLHREQGVTVQLGGSDQWGNIVAGCDLIRRVVGLSEQPSASDEEHREHAHLAFGMTAPLVTKSDGSKFGKTASGAVWLTPDRTSPYAIYQFWLNTPDADIGRFLRIFTEIPLEEIESIEKQHTDAPHERIAQRRLAQEATELLHGSEAVEHAERASQALFSGDVSGLSAEMLDEVFSEAPSTEHTRSDLAGDGVDLVELLPQTSLCKSKREAREFLGNGAVSVNGEKVDAEHRLTADDLLHDRVILLRRGRKAWHVTLWV